MIRPGGVNGSNSVDEEARGDASFDKFVFSSSSSPELGTKFRYSGSEYDSNLAVYAKTLPCPEEEEGEEEEEEIADPVRSRKTYVFSIDRVSVSYAISYEIIYVRICTVRPFFLEGV